jgi:LAO/AO transport system kinase
MSDLAQRILQGDHRALARAATLIENGDASLLDQLPVRPSVVIGVTGPPGAGKSTLVNGLIYEFRKQGSTVAVIAVDPSSEITGGAILGDRIRMQDHYKDAGVFIRSSASRGAHGGLASTTANLVALFRRSVFDVVLVETVGVGQADIDISRLADLTLVVVVPGMGDEVQTIKAGIMEVADIFVLNKADRPGAAILESDLRDSLGAAQVVKTVATEGQGIAELVAAIRDAARVS